VTNATVCRFCEAPLSRVVVDLGMSPLSNALIEPAHASEVEPVYPLCVFVCQRCWLVQVPAFESRDQIFREYSYFSSYSATWLAHSRAYAQDVTAKLGLSSQHLVVELASNDGYLLKEFRRRSIPVLGIEPARNVAREAVAAGVPTLAEFFGAALARRLASEGRSADLIVANNVLAHVPDVNDFVAGIRALLKPGGTATLEFPHLLRMLQRVEFDTIYHEHFSYFSLRAAQRIFEKHALSIADVEELPTHGGSLRIWVRHARTDARTSGSVDRVLGQERDAGLESLRAYDALQGGAEKIKGDLIGFLQEARRAGKRVAGYGAPAKSTTLLNYCGIRAELLPYTVDASPHKQGRLIPGVRVPIEAPERIFQTKPDYVLVLPWNIKDEIVEQMAGIRAWGGRFVVPIPALEILD